MQMQQSSWITIRTGASEPPPWIDEHVSLQRSKRPAAGVLRNLKLNAVDDLLLEMFCDRPDFSIEPRKDCFAEQLLQWLCNRRIHRPTATARRFLGCACPQVRSILLSRKRAKSR